MRFKYVEPVTVEEAIFLLSDYGDRAKVLAGGTDVVVRMKERTISPEYVVAIGNLVNLDYINLDNNNTLRIGTLTTIHELEQCALLRTKYNLLVQASEQLADVAIRNMATIGGNLCNAAPSADMAPPLLALSADVKLVSNAGERTIPLEDLFTGPYQTVVRLNELMVEILVPPLPVRTGGVYLKHMIRGTGGLGSVGAAVFLSLHTHDDICSDARIAFGAVASKPFRAHETETFLKGRAITEDIIEEAAKISATEARPRDSIRGSAWYKRELLKVMTGEAVRQALEQARSVV